MIKNTESVTGIIAGNKATVDSITTTINGIGTTATVTANVSLKPLDALDKLDHTLCLNILEKNLKFGLDEEHHIDCTDVYEMINCIDVIRKYLVSQLQAPLHINWNNEGYLVTTDPTDPCASCPCRGGLKDGLGNPIAGDSPCDWCPHKKYRAL